MIQAQQDIDQLCINTTRTLAMDAVQQAHSGYPLQEAYVWHRPSVPIPLPNLKALNT